MIQKIIIVRNEYIEIAPELQDLIEKIKDLYKIDVEMFDYRKKIDQTSEDTLFLLYLDDISIKAFLKNHLNTKTKIGFIPNEECTRTLNSYAISKKIDTAIEEAMDEDNLSCVDILTCNGEVVFTDVVVGDVHGLNYKNIDNQSIFYKIKNFYLNLKHLGFEDYTMTTAKGESTQTAATGLMILEHNSVSVKYNLVNEDLSLHDGKLNAFIISPTCIFSYIYYLLVVNFFTKLNPNNLPKTLGFIKTSQLDITSVKPMNFMIDGILMSAKEINLQVMKESLTLSIGKNVIEDAESNMQTDEDKEIIRTQYLPKGEVKDLLLRESVPLFKKATEDDFKELFSALKENAKSSSIYIILIIVSTLIATTGLFQNSSAVIIGAMILAPLMSPIISLSMGVARGDSYFITNSLKTLGLGILIALIFSSIYAYFMPLNFLTDEMRSRLNPNILDLMVAIFSGIAGAYANAKSEIAKSLAGVAIAVALVPPLSITGIGLGWGDFYVSYGAFLLFLTNLVGITLSATITFLVLGYSPINRAKKGIIYTSTILAMVTVPLIFSFNKVLAQNNITSKLNNFTVTENNKTITIDVLNVDLSKEQTVIFLQTNSNKVLDNKDLNLLKKDIENTLQEKVILNISTNIIIQ